MAGCVLRGPEHIFERANDRYMQLVGHRRTGQPPEERYVDFVYQVLRDPGGATTGVVVVGVDTTDRRNAEERLRASEERYRTLVEATASIAWNSPASGAFDTDQPAWTAFTGQTVEQHRGSGWLDAIHPDDREKSGRAWANAVAGKGDYQVEHRLRRADGVYRHMTVRAVLQSFLHLSLLGHVCMNAHPLPNRPIEF